MSAHAENRMSDKEIINPPNTLKKAKIGSGPGVLDPNLLKKAEQAMSNMSSEYPEWAREDLLTLEGVIEKLRAGGADVAAELKNIFRMAIDMKGQGGSFGYILITAVADSLMKFVEDKTEVSEFDLEVMAAHTAAMRAVLTEEIQDDGGPVGEELMDGLFKLKVKAAG